MSRFVEVIRDVWAKQHSLEWLSSFISFAFIVGAYAIIGRAVFFVFGKDMSAWIRWPGLIIGYVIANKLVPNAKRFQIVSDKSPALDLSVKTFGAILSVCTYPFIGYANNGFETDSSSFYTFYWFPVVYSAFLLLLLPYAIRSVRESLVKSVLEA